MPGVRLSQSEQSLIDKWSLKTPYSRPRLASLSIASTGNGLRGIKDLSVNLNHPITVLCGAHGSGKSTILALCRLAFADDVAFDDLFIEVNNAHPFSDFSASWSYLNPPPDAIHFYSSTRMYSTERPTKPVDYIGLSRIVPAWEKPPLVQHFRQNQAMEQSELLDDRHTTRLKDTLNKQYLQASQAIAAGYEIRTCSTGASYTSFNMCTGEEVLVGIYHLLQSSAPESLILIEDAEIGLNPVVIPKFAKNLVDICLEKRLQIILTTHSLDLITAFPREFVCLIKSDGTAHKTVNDPNMQDVLISITSQTEQDMIVFCEDVVAESLIKQAVSGDLRRRLKIVYGSKTKLLGYAEAHLKAGWPLIPVIVWDGDVTGEEVADWLKKFDQSTKDELVAKVSFLSLPGTEPPERWIVSQLSTDEGCTQLANEINEDEMTVRTFLGMLTTMSAFHSVSYELAKKTSLDKASVQSALIKTVNRLSTHPLDSLKSLLEKTANQEVVSDPKFARQP